MTRVRQVTAFLKYRQRKLFELSESTTAYFVPGESESYPETSTIRTAPAPSSYAENLRRHYELGNKRYPTRQEISEFTDLDARLSVQEGFMTVEQYEKWTGKKY